MAECYHKTNETNCVPNGVANESYRTLISQYDGTCNGCGGPYEKGQRIAYFNNGSTTRRSSEPVQSTGSGDNSQLIKRLDALEAENKKLRQLVNECDKGYQDWLDYKVVFDHVDFRKCPQLPNSPFKNTALDVFDGKELAF